MNTQITEDYVSFEVAKLLREKGFEGDCNATYGMMKGELNVNNHSSSNGGNLRCLAPTLQMTMKWLREVHDLHIIAYPWKADKEKKAFHWCCQVYKSFNLLGCEKYKNETCRSYEEAVEAAIKYCLTNLI